MPKSRVKSSSDCIIAFAITLLILDIHLQDIGADIDNAGMIRAFMTLVPHFSIDVISFLVCTVWWVSHHALIYDLDHVDPKFLCLNSLSLSCGLPLSPFQRGCSVVIRVSLWQSRCTVLSMRPFASIFQNTNVVQKTLTITWRGCYEQVWVTLAGFLSHTEPGERDRWCSRGAAEENRSASARAPLRVSLTPKV